MSEYEELIRGACFSDIRLAPSIPTKEQQRMRYARQRRYEKSHPEYTRERAKQKSVYTPLPFCGVDGEGGTNTAGIHSYYLIRAGERTLRTGERLSAAESLRFIGSLPDKQCFVGYFFNYDVTMMLSPQAGFPLDKIGELLYKDRRKLRRDGQPFPIRWRDFEIEYIPSKRFTVSLINPLTNRVYQTRTIHDVSGFFQCSFVKALELWEIGTPEQIALVKQGKEKRSEFTGEISAEEMEYSRLECMLLAELMEALRKAARDAEIPVGNYEGAGCLASGLLSKHKISRYSQPLPSGVQEAAQSAYFGGRFEVTGIGHFRNIYQYDVNSAYPYQTQSLPCLVHGKWERGRYMRGKDTIGMARIRWTSKLPASIIGAMPVCSPFPFRSHTGRIYYPLEGAGWYWYDEIRAGLNAGLWEWDIDILETWTYKQECDHRPFDFVPEYYQRRQEWGKDGKGKVVKLALNSLYGKTAQSVGRPRYANPVWAGLITSRTRALLYQYIAPADCDILMVATDGLYSLTPLPVPIGNGLGEWTETLYPHFFLVQPGIYFGGDALLDTTKRTRGAPANLIVREQFAGAWERDRENGIVTIPMHNFVGLRSGYHMKHYDSIGQWIEQERQIRFMPYTKLIPEKGAWQDTAHMRLLPWPACHWQEESTPYNRAILPQFDRETEREWEEDQPDYGDYLGAIF